MRSSIQHRPRNSTRRCRKSSIPSSTRNSTPPISLKQHPPVVLKQHPGEARSVSRVSWVMEKTAIGFCALYGCGEPRSAVESRSGTSSSAMLEIGLGWEFSAEVLTWGMAGDEIGVGIPSAVEEADGFVLLGWPCETS